MNASGVGGDLIVSGRQAARIGEWELHSDATLTDVSVVRARLFALNAFWVVRKPLRLVLHLGGSQWSWDNAVLDPAGVDPAPYTIRVVGMPQEHVQ